MVFQITCMDLLYNTEKLSNIVFDLVRSYEAPRCEKQDIIQGLMWQIVGRHVSKSNAETGTYAPNTLVKISTLKANQTLTQPNRNKIKKDSLVSPSCSKLIDRHWY